VLSPISSLGSFGFNFSSFINTNILGDYKNI
jgi:hypothetical protein